MLDDILRKRCNMKNNIIKVFPLITLLLILCHVFLQSDEKPPTKTGQESVSFETTVRLKIFDVLLLNSEGIPIRGMDKDKFRLFIDGNRADIDTFDIVDYKEPKSDISPSTDNEPVPNKIEEDCKQDGLGDKHLFILLFHNLPRNKELRRNIASAISDFFEDQKNPRNYFAVYYFSGEKITLLMPFTNNTSQLRNVINDLYIENKLNLFPMLPVFLDNNSLLRKAGVRKPNRAMDSIGNIDFLNQINQAANVLDILIRSLGSDKGRKEILIFSDSIDLFRYSFEGKKRVELNRMILDARNNNIAINTFDLTKMSGFDMSGSGGADYLLRELDDQPLSYLQNMGIIKKFRADMRDTSLKTGGLHTDKAYSADITRKGIENIYERTSYVYFLGIYLNKYKFDDGKEHTVEIQVDGNDIEAIYQPNFKIETEYRKMDEVDRLSQFLDAFYGVRDFTSLNITDAFLHFPYGENGNLLVNVYDMPLTPESGNKYIVAARYYNVKTMNENQAIKIWDINEQRVKTDASAARFLIAVPLSSGRYIYRYAVRDEDNGLMKNSEYYANIDSGKNLLSSISVFGNTKPYINFTNILDKNIPDKKAKSDEGEYLINLSLNPFNYEGRFLAPIFGDPLLRSGEGFIMYMYNSYSVSQNGYSLSYSLSSSGGKDFTNLLKNAEPEKAFSKDWRRVTLKFSPSEIPADINELKFLITIKDASHKQIETQDITIEIQ